MDQKIKQTIGKVPLGNLLDFKNALKEVSKVREYGLKKYPDAKSYKQVPEKELINATVRHLFADCDNVVDDESNCLHLAHMVCNLLMIIEKRGEKK